MNSATKTAALLTLLSVTSASLSAQFNGETGPGKTLTPLMIAAHKDDLRRVHNLLAHGANVNERSPAGETALYEAIERTNPTADNLPVVNALIDAGADPNQPTIFNASPLMISLTRDYGNPAVTLRLLRAGAHVSHSCEPGDSAVSLAAQDGTAAVVEALLKAGSPPNCQGMHGETALHWAAMNGFVDTVAALLADGADPFLRDQSGKTPFDVATVTNPDKRVQQQFSKTRLMLQDAMKNKPLAALGKSDLH